MYKFLFQVYFWTRKYPKANLKKVKEKVPDIYLLLKYSHFPPYIYTLSTDL